MRCTGRSTAVRPGPTPARDPPWSWTHRIPICARCTFRHSGRMPDPTIAATPSPPYVAVIFTSVRTDGDDDGYAAMAAAMERLAREQPGYLGIETAREGVGI